MAVTTEKKQIRAVAEEGVELVKRVHRDHLGNRVITIKQANGLVHEVPYSDEDVATPVLIEAMLEDMLPPNRKVNKAIKKYCLNYIKGWGKLVEDPEIDGIKMKELPDLVVGFEAGWRAARTGSCTVV